VPNMMQAGIAWLRDQQVAHASIEVTYMRGIATYPLHAVPARTRTDRDDIAEIAIDEEMRDWIFAAEEVPGNPERGDRIQSGDELYEVLSANGSPVWTWSDNYHVRRRVTTKRIATPSSE
jgi:hypothetical protein